VENNKLIKCIKGSWFEFQHHNKSEGIYWNTTCAAFTGQDWENKIREISETGMEYLVLMCVALDYKAFYDTDILPKADIACSNPIEAILSAADKFGIKFFIGADFFGDWLNLDECINDPAVCRNRLKSMNELAGLYGHHKSFYGWYWSEVYIDKYFAEDFIRYINNCSSEGRKLMPDAKTLIAPYGTRTVLPDDKFVSQLEQLDVDYIAYQDEVGVRKTKVEESAAYFEGLRKAHDRAQRAALWADVEIFEFEGEVYKSALLPAPFSRIEKQLEAVLPFVDTILVYQYQGMMNKPGSKAFAGHPRSVELYMDYTNWLKKHFA
jgi:hypothetical protein